MSLADGTIALPIKLVHREPEKPLIILDPDDGTPVIILTITHQGDAHEPLTVHPPLSTPALPRGRTVIPG